MKITRLGIVTVLAASMFIMPACKKKSEDPEPEEEVPVTPVVTYGSFSAKIDGSSKSYPINNYIVNGGTAISATETGGTSIGLVFLGTSTGTYEYDPTFPTTIMTYSSGSSSSQATSGKIVITKYADKKISGTFEFSVKGGVTVTEGSFTDVPLK